MESAVDVLAVQKAVVKAQQQNHDTVFDGEKSR